jgi:predicted Zn-dependent peptidase
MNLMAVEYARGGSFETPGTRGISHLMEHLMCKTFDTRREYLKSLGVDYNAYTDNNQVVFWWSGLDTSIREVSQEMFECLTKQKTLWTEEAFNNEKKTVLQEYGDTFNDQYEGFFENLMRKHYGYCDPIGYREDIEKFSYADSLEYAATHFLCPRLLCEVGESFVGNVETSAYQMVPQFRLQYMENSGLELETVPREDKTFVGLMGKPIPVDKAAKIDFIISCITGGLESPLYLEIREKRGLSYFSSGFTNKVGDSMVPFFCASTGNERANELAKVYEDFFSQSAVDYFTEERFNACHKNLMIKKTMAEILPHSGAKITVIGEHNPFTDMETFTYTEGLTLTSSYFSPENLQPVQY